MTYRAARQLTLTMIATSVLTISACGNPCVEIAEVTCATAGADSDECARIEKLAAHASADDRRACEVAVNLVESLEKVQ